MAPTRSSLPHIRKLTIDAMGDFKEHTKDEIIKNIETTNKIKLGKEQKSFVSYVLRTYAGIVKSTREHRHHVFKLSRAHHKNVLLKTRLEDEVNKLSDLQLQLENINLEMGIRVMTEEVIKVERDIAMARQSRNETILSSDDVSFAQWDDSVSSHGTTSSE